MKNFLTNELNAMKIKLKSCESYLTLQKQTRKAERIQRRAMECLQYFKDRNMRFIATFNDNAFLENLARMEDYRD